MQSCGTGNESTPRQFRRAPTSAIFSGRATPGAPEAEEGIGWRAGDVIVVTDHAKRVVQTILVTDGRRQHNVR
jgi:hypothetical protein